jgi:PAS domain S-box-containing protein
VTSPSNPDRRPPKDVAEAETPSSASAEIIAILDTIDVPIVVVSRDCTVVRFNGAASAALGLGGSDIGARLGSIEALADVKQIESLCGQVIADEAPARRDVRSGDRRFQLRVSPYAIRAGEIAGAVLTFTNVTAFRASVEQAIYEREYTKAILNAVTSPVVVLDSDLRVQSGNRAFYSMFGVAREKVHGIPLPDLGDDAWKASDVWTALRAMPVGGPEFPRREVERHFPGIGARTVLLEARRVPREGDATIVLAVQDVTERKRTEEELLNADRRKDEFLALLAHELRNPLAPIRTALELMRVSGDTPPSFQSVRSMMERQVGQMVRLIDDLLDVSRIASGKIVLRRVPTSLTELLQTSIEVHRPMIEAAGIQLTVELPSHAYVVDVDPTRFVQILSNVLHNASKFTPRGGRIRCSVDTRRVDDLDWITVTISDTGVGISNDMLPRVFDMFTQADSPAERTHGGLGIGLALARQLAEMHGGQIGARSEGPGQGSAFSITVPVCDSPAAGPSVGELDVPTLSCRVIIVDDNRDAAEMMSMLVTEMGGTARTAHDAASGLSAVREFLPDIVFLDIGMPGMDGYEACRRIRHEASDKPVFIVAVTGWGQSNDKKLALDAGFDAHLTKPVDPALLGRILAAGDPGAPIKASSPNETVTSRRSS